MLRHRRRRRVESWAGRCTTKVGIKRRREEKKKRKGKEKRKIKENKRNGKSGSDDRWATARVEVPVYKLAVTTTHTLADLNTLFIPREGSPPSLVSFRSRKEQEGREGGPPSSSSYTWLMSRGHPRCPNFYRLSRFMFWPVSSPWCRGVKRF